MLQRGKITSCYSAEYLERRYLNIVLLSSVLSLFAGINILYSPILLIYMLFRFLKPKTKMSFKSQRTITSSLSLGDTKYLQLSTVLHKISSIQTNKLKCDGKQGITTQLMPIGTILIDVLKQNFRKREKRMQHLPKNVSHTCTRKKQSEKDWGEKCTRWSNKFGKH